MPISLRNKYHFRWIGFVAHNLRLLGYLLPHNGTKQCQSSRKLTFQQLQVIICALKPVICEIHLLHLHAFNQGSGCIIQPLFAAIFIMIEIARRTRWRQFISGNNLPERLLFRTINHPILTFTAFSRYIPRQSTPPFMIPSPCQSLHGSLSRINLRDHSFVLQANLSFSP